MKIPQSHLIYALFYRSLMDLIERVLKVVTVYAAAELKHNYVGYSVLCYIVLVNDVFKSRVTVNVTDLRFITVRRKNLKKRRAVRVTYYKQVTAGVVFGICDLTGNHIELHIMVVTAFCIVGAFVVYQE